MSTKVDLTPEQVALRELVAATLEEHQRITVPGGCTCGGIYVNHTEHLVAMVAQAIEGKPEKAKPVDDFEDQAQRIAKMFGDGIHAQVTNTEYLIERGRPPTGGHRTLALFRRAAEIQKGL